MNMKVVIEERIKEAQKNRDQSIFVLRHELKSAPELKAYLKKKNYALRPLYGEFRFKGYEVFFEGVTHKMKYQFEEIEKSRKWVILGDIVYLLFVVGLFAVFIRLCVISLY